nr:hypothetical protein [Sulfurimonas sp. SAG-AH-194-C21]
MKVLILVLYLLVLVGCSSATPKHNERYYQTKLCNSLDGEMEVVLEDKTRVDCLTDEYAIEVDFAKKWAESVGQSLYYGHMTNKAPAIALIVKKDKDERYLKRVKVLTDKYGIKLFVIDK